MKKQQKFHHSVTENGKLQLRIITEYQDDEGKMLDKKYSDPVTTADTKDMTGWDEKSKEIVAAITDEKVADNFHIERLATGLGIVGAGLEEAITYDRVIEPDGKIAVRRITRIFDDGVEVSKKYHRSWIMPGDDPSKTDVISKALAEKLHTPEVIKAYDVKMKELEDKADVGIS